MTRRRPDREGFARELVGLSDLPLDILRQRWQDLFGLAPPPRLGRSLILRAVAHRLQEKHLGGLKPAVARQLDRAAQNLAAGRTPATVASAIKPGTRLLRDWQGVTHEVIVLDQGVRYQGQTWRSLSEVARAITGARWSGPKFFGLKERRDEAR